MKNREELLTELEGSKDFGQDDPEGAIYVAVDGTTYAIVEYIDDAMEKWGDTPVVGQVLMMLRNNALQFAGNK